MKKFIILFSLFLSFLILNITYAANIIITEVMYNPEDSDSGFEWFEAINLGDNIEVKTGKNGWRVVDSKSHILKGESFVWNSNEIIIFTQSSKNFSSLYPQYKGKIIESSFYLTNKEGVLQILDENRNLISQFKYNSNLGGNGNGYTLVYDSGVIREGNIKNGSPGIYPEPNIIKDNKITEENIKLTQSTTTDLSPTGINTDTSSIATSIKFTNIEQSINKTIPETIVITEFLPDLEGKDEDEFIEIFNYGDESIDLNNFYLKVGDKIIKLYGFIEPNEYKVFYKNNLGFNIRNNGEAIKILNNKKEEIFSIKYEGKAKTGKSFARDEEGNWKWTIPTPGEKNMFNVNIEEELNNDIENDNNKQIANFLASTYELNKKDSRINTVNSTLIGVIISIILSVLFVLFLK
ncbi:MAG: lamin tail domain-containing protein [Candidatus Aenigmatarchaeota archaeon]